MNMSRSSFSFVMQERVVRGSGVCRFFIASSTFCRVSGDILLVSIGGAPEECVMVVVSQRPGLASSIADCPQTQPERATNNTQNVCFMRSSITLKFEFDPLSERKFAGPVDRNRLPPHIGFP